MPVSERSREQALELAHSLIKPLRERPGKHFAQLARDLSEDPITAPLGGRLGTYPATELALWPAILDCMAPLREGEVSEPVETEFGFHVFRRDAMPPSELFAARRIVIGYSDAGFLQYVHRANVGARARRSKHEALELATRIAARATRENFEALVREFSDHRDSGRGGDIGMWSTWEPTIFPRLMDAILETPLNEVSKPVDSELGYQVFLRTEAHERSRAAMKAVRFAFDPAAPDGSPGSAKTALELAEKFVANLRESASTSEALDAKRRLDAASTETWSEGRGPHGAEEVVPLLAINDVISRPFVSDYTYVVARRVEPPGEERSSRGTPWLPAPEYPDALAFIQMRSPVELSRVFAAASNVLPETCSSCKELHATMLARLVRAAAVQERTAAWNELTTQLAPQLDPSSFEEYRQALLRAMSDEILGRGKQAGPGGQR